MKKRSFFVVVFSIVAFLGCTQTTNSNNKGSINQVSPIEFNKQIETNEGIVLDVRTENEFKSGHIKNAIQLNYYAINFKKELLLLSNDKPIYVYCHSGARSKRTCEILNNNGYQNIYNLTYGLLKWDLQELPIEKGTKSKHETKTEEKNKMTVEQYNNLLKSNDLVFIDFYAPWCKPCIEMMPLIEELEKEYKGKIKIVKINTETSKDLLKKLNISSIPYLIFYNNEKIVFQKAGKVTRNEIVTIFDKELNK